MLMHTKSYLELLGDHICVSHQQRVIVLLLYIKNEILWVEHIYPCSENWQARDIQDLGSLKEAAKIFVPGMHFFKVDLFNNLMVLDKEEDSFIHS